MSRPFRHKSQARPKLVNLTDTFERAKPIVFGGETRKSRRVQHQNRNRGYIQKFSYGPYNTRGEIVQKIVRLVRVLQQEGFLVPKIKAIDQTKSIIEFENAGQSLHDRLRKQLQNETPAAQKQAIDLLAKTFRMIGRLHGKGYSHEHPIMSNIIVKGNQIGLIDLVAVEEVSKNIWKNGARTIQQTLQRDYYFLQKDLDAILKGVKITNPPQQKRIQRAMWTRLVNRYPCDANTKEILIERLATGKDFK